MLKQLGIEKGEPFEPDERLTGILTGASAAGELMAQANTFAKRFDGSRYWPDRQWDLAIVLDNSQQRGTYYDELLERASWFYEAVSFSEAMKSQTPGRRPGLPRQLHRRRRRVARRRPHLHPARARRPAGQAVLVGDRLRRRHPLPHRQRPAARRPRLTRRRPRRQRRRLRRPVVRTRPRRRAASRTGCRPSPASTGSRTSGSTDHSSPTSTAAGSSATSRRPAVRFPLIAHRPQPTRSQEAVHDGYRRRLDQRR